MSDDLAAYPVSSGILLQIGGEADHAATELLRLAKIPGTLNVITNAPSRNAYLLGPHHPYATEVRPVERLTGPNRRGEFRAYSAQGDYCEGPPEALLARLTEWQRWHMRGRPIQGPGEFYVEQVRVRGRR